MISYSFAFLFQRHHSIVCDSLFPVSFLARPSIIGTSSQSLLLTLNVTGGCHSIFFAYFVVVKLIFLQSAAASVYRRSAPIKTWHYFLCRVIFQPLSVPSRNSLTTPAWYQKLLGAFEDHDYKRHNENICITIPTLDTLTYWEQTQQRADIPGVYLSNRPSKDEDMAMPRISLFQTDTEQLDWISSVRSKILPNASSKSQLKLFSKSLTLRVIFSLY